MPENILARSGWRAGAAAALLGLSIAALGCNESQSGAEGGNASASSPAPAKRATTVRDVTIPPGTAMVAALQGTIDTDKNHVGDRFTMRTVEPVLVGVTTAVPVGSTINGEITHLEDAGRIKGGAELTLRFLELVTPDGKSYPLSCEPFRLTTKGDGKESTAEIAGGAAAGGIVGGIAGGGDGALKGAAIGGILGAGVAVATKGDDITVPAGQKLRVSVASPVTVRVQPLS